MVIVRRELCKSVKRLRDKTERSAEEMLYELQERVCAQAEKCGIVAGTLECEYCHGGKLAALSPKNRERCFVIHNPEHSDWRKYICLVHRMGKINYYEFYALSDSRRLSELGTQNAGKVRLRRHNTRDESCWEAEIVRIIREMAK